MKEEKGLPVEVVNRFFKGLSYEQRTAVYAKYGYNKEGDYHIPHSLERRIIEAVITEHGQDAAYAPILQGKDAKIEQLEKVNEINERSIKNLHEDNSKLIDEKAKLMGLLENAFKAEWVNTITEAFADGAAAQRAANNEWNEYKLKNGLSE